MFEKPQRFNRVCAIFPKWHIEPARNWEGLAIYCAKGRKEGSATECIITKGMTSQQGKRTDLESYCERIKKGELVEEVALSQPATFVKFFRGLGALANIVASPRETRMAPKICWIYGETGTGKSHSVFARENVARMWVSGDRLTFFNGFIGQRVALFDDFRGDMCKLRWLLRLFDKYPCIVDTKGGWRWWRPERIWVTSCSSPEQIYDSTTEKIGQLLRRISTICEFSRNGVEYRKGSREDYVPVLKAFQEL